MTRVPMTQAVAADYADAMLVARRAKNFLFLILALILLIQVGVFFVVKYVPSVRIRTEVATNTVATPDTNSGSVTLLERQPADSGQRQKIWSPILEQVIAATDFLGVLLSIVLPIVLLLIVTIMLVGRLVGVAHVTSAFCWSIFFLVFLFPWQCLLNSDAHAHGALSTTQPSMMISANDVPDVRIPGTLYTFTELRRGYDFPNTPIQYAILGWGRFVGFPLLELIILLVINGRSSRGLRFALGESEIPADFSTPVAT